MSTGAFDLDELVDRLGGDRHCAGELIGIFLDDTRPRLAFLAEPVADLPALRRVAHTLKGSCGNMAAHRASGAAAALEASATAGDAGAADAARLVLVAELEHLFAVLERAGVAADDPDPVAGMEAGATPCSRA